MPVTEPRLSSYRSSDLPELILLLNEAERELRDFRPYTEEEFDLNYLQDETFDPEGLTLAWTGSKLEGAAYAQVDPEYVRFHNQLRGFIKWIRVRREDASSGLRTLLLQASVKYLVSHQMQEGLVSVPSHNRLDLDFFEKNGFSSIRNFNYMERLLSRKIEEASLPSGYSWTHFKKGEERQWVDCINSAFRNHWGKRPMGVNEFSRWTRDPSFDSSGIIGIRKGPNLVGIIYCEIDAAYAEYTGRKRSMLWIIGVIPPERGFGLGKALTIAGIDWSLRNGMRFAALYVDSENERAVSLYRHLAFEPVYQVHHLLKRFD